MSHALRMCFFRLCLFTLFLGNTTGKLVRQFNLIDFNFTQSLSENEINDVLRADKTAQIAIINDYIDQLLPNLNAFVSAQGIDPVALSDVGGKFGIGFIKGELSLKKGQIYGIATFLRKGDVEVWYEFQNVKIKAPLRFGKLGFNYDYVIQFLGLGPEGIARGEVKGCRWVVHLQVNMTTLLARLEKYELQSLGNVTLQFDGGILELVLNIVVAVAIGLVKPVIAIVLEGIIEGGFSSFIDAYNTIVQRFLEGGTV